MHGGILLRRYREHAGDPQDMPGGLLLSGGIRFRNPLPGWLLQRSNGVLDAGHLQA